MKGRNDFAFKKRPDFQDTDCPDLGGHFFQDVSDAQ